MNHICSLNTSDAHANRSSNNCPLMTFLNIDLHQNFCGGPTLASNITSKSMEHKKNISHSRCAWPGQKQDHRQTARPANRLFQ